MMKNFSKNLLIAYLLLTMVLPYSTLLVQPAQAQDSSQASSTDTSSVTPSVNQPTVTEDETDQDYLAYVATHPYTPETPLGIASSVLDNMHDRRLAAGEKTSEGSPFGSSNDSNVPVASAFPRVQMSQCDAALLRQNKIDGRIVDAINHLVQPTDVKGGGGAGITYLYISFSKSCPQNVPDLIGGAYPVTFPDDPAVKSDQTKIQPGSILSDNNTKNAQFIIEPTIRTVTPPTTTAQTPNVAQTIKNALIPSAEAASATAPTTQSEPAGADAVHQAGKAVDILGAGLVMCTSKSGGLIGTNIGAKITHEAPRPVKVAWQTDQGVAGVQSPFGREFDETAQNIALDQFMSDFTGQNSSYKAQDMNSMFGILGFNALANVIGVRPGSFDPSTAPLTYNTLGYALLSDLFQMPNSSVFNLYNSNLKPTNGHSYTDTLLQNAMLNKVETDLKLPPGSLQGSNIDDVMASAGKRELERQLGLKPQSLSGNFDNPQAILQSIGQAKMETAFRWPTGTVGIAPTSGQSTVNALVDQLSKLTGLQGDSKLYATNILRSTLSLPTSVPLDQITNKNSDFWKSDDGKKTKESLGNIDRQLYPNADSGSKPKSIFDNGALPIVDTTISKDDNDLTYRMITGDLGLSDYQTIVGTGAVLTNYGQYDSAARAFDMPLDPAPTFDSTAKKAVVGQKNDFLTNLIKGNKDDLVALGVNAISKALGENPDHRTQLIQNALSGKRNFDFDGSHATLTSPLGPSDLMWVLGSFLSTDSSGKNATALADQRFNKLVAMGQQQFGNVIGQAATNAIADPTLSTLLAQYNQNQPTNQDVTETQAILGDGNNQFTLSQSALRLSNVTISYTDSSKVVKASLGSDRTTVTVDQGAINNASYNTPIRFTYTVQTHATSQTGQVNAGTFYSLLNNPTAFNALALQYGAAKASGALNLAPNALAEAAQIITGAGSSSGTTSVGQAALEQAAGVAPGVLKGTLSDAFTAGMSISQVEQMLHLAPGSYALIKANDQSFLSDNALTLSNNDDYYHLPSNATVDLIQGKMSLDNYKKYIGQGQMRFNTGQVLASNFDLQIAGYRLNASDFTDLLDGSAFSILQKIGARETEKNHGLPIGALAASVISGANDVSLWSLGSGVLSSVFHLNQIDLSGVKSLDDAKFAIGQSTVEQALGLKANSFDGSSLIDVARNTGGENFASAFGITLPASVQAKMDAVYSTYRPDLVAGQRNLIALDYLQTLFNQKNYDSNAQQRFAAIDRTLGIDSGTTAQLMSGSLATNDFVDKASSKAVSDGITGDLSQILGIPQQYAIVGKDIINAINGGSTGKSFGDLYALIQKVGGINVDAQLGWRSGTFQTLLGNHSDIAVKQAIIGEGVNLLSQAIGLPAADVQAAIFNGSTLLPQFGGITSGSVDAANALPKILALKFSKTINAAGFDTNEAVHIFDGGFGEGLLMAGIAYTSKSLDMKAAGVTYKDLKLSIMGDPNEEDTYLTNQISQDAVAGQLPSNHDFGTLNEFKDAAEYLPYVETSRRSYMQEARQNVSYKFLDYQARQLFPDIPLPPGFTKALVGGQYTYLDNGQLVTLTGDNARWAMGKQVLLGYIGKNIDILKQLPPNITGILTDFLIPGNSYFGDSKALETRLTSANGIKAMGTVFDNVASKIFGSTLPAGTGAAIAGYFVDPKTAGNISKVGENIWNAWQGQALGWADKAFGFQPGTASVIYQGVVGYQQALASYRIANITAASNLAAGIDAGDLGAFDQFDQETSAASTKLNTQKVQLIAQVASVVFSKQIAAIETALGLAPGTLMYLIQYLIHPDPISLGLFIFFNFFWNKPSVTCGIDYYPGSGGGGIPPAVTALQAALGGTTASTDTTAASDTNVGKIATANSVDLSKLLPPDHFNGMSNDAYRAGIKAGAQYEVRRVIGSLLYMPTVTSNKDLTPTQIGTFSVDDLNLFAKFSEDLYGPVNTRFREGPGTFNMPDRIHLGY